MSTNFITMVYMYSETDGDSGDYNIVLFSEKKDAETYKRLCGSAYGQVTEKKLYARPATIREVRGY